MNAVREKEKGEGILTVREHPTGSRRINRSLRDVWGGLPRGVDREGVIDWSAA